MTISEALTLQRAIKTRIGDLENLRSDVAKKDRYLFGDKERITEPQYDVRAVDKKITVLQQMLFEIDTAIKTSNATTKITVEIDRGKIFEPIS